MIIVKYIDSCALHDYRIDYKRNIEDLNGNGTDIALEVGTEIDTFGLNYHLFYKAKKFGMLEISLNKDFHDVQNICYLIYNENSILTLSQRPSFEKCSLKLVIPNKELDYKDYAFDIWIKRISVYLCDRSDIIVLIDEYEIDELKCYYFDENNGILFHGDEVAGVHMKNLTDEEKQELLRYRTYDEETHSWRDLREEVGPPVKLMTPYVKKQND